MERGVFEGVVAPGLGYEWQIEQRTWHAGIITAGAAA